MSGLGTSTMTTPIASISPPPEEELSNHLATFVPSETTTEERHRADVFKGAYISTLKGDVRGALTPHLFHDLSEKKNARDPFSGLDYDATTLLSGGLSWDRHIGENVNKEAQYGFHNSDQSVIKTSLEKGLLDALPGGALRLFSYGGGDRQAFIHKEGQFIKALKNSFEHEVVSLSAVDILRRYSYQNAFFSSEHLGVRSHTIVGDFMENGKLATPENEKGRAFIMVFGGPLLNAPIHKDGPPAEDKYIQYLHKMTLQHGVGTFVAMTVDTDQDPKRQEENYKIRPRDPFESFTLSAHARAMQQGIILKPFDIFKHWRANSRYDDTINAVDIFWECKKKLNITTQEEFFSFSRGNRQTVTLSHKWDEAKHRDLCAQAGWKVHEIFEEKDNPNKLVLAESIALPGPAF